MKKLEKKALSLFLCLAMVASLFGGLALTASAEDEAMPTMEAVIPKDSYEADDVFTVNVYVKNATFNTLGFAMHYDPTVMQAYKDDSAYTDGTAFVVTENAYDSNKDTGYLVTNERTFSTDTGNFSWTAYVSTSVTNGTVTADSQGFLVASMSFKMLAAGTPSLSFAADSTSTDFKTVSFKLLNGGTDLANAQSKVTYTDTTPSDTAYSIGFSVKDSSSGDTISGAVVTVKNSSDETADAESDGSYNLADGDYTYTVSAEGYADGSGSFTVADAAATIDVTLSASAAATTYNVTIDNSAANGSISADKTSAAEGDTVTVTVSPDTGYVLTDDSLKYTTDGGENYTAVSETDGVYSFTMPAADVSVTAAFEVSTAGTLSTVYLNGSSGSDDKDGTSSGKAVKTFAKAKSLLAKDGTIYITNTVTVTSDETWSLPSNIYGSAKVMRSFYGQLVKITGGTLTLENIVIDGNGSTYYGSTNFFITLSGDSAGLVMNDGAVLQNNTNNGSGGGVWVTSGTFTMNGGLITGNIGSNGDGVCVGNSATFTMNGGTITGNTSNLDRRTNDFQVSSNSAIKTVIGPDAEIDGRVYINSGLGGYLAVTGELGHDILLRSGATTEGTVVAKGENGYTLTQADCDKLTWGGNGTYYFVLDSDNNDIYLTAVDPSLTRYTITSSASDGGSISPSGDTTVVETYSQTYTITPSDGYIIADVDVDGASIYSTLKIDETGATSYTFSGIDGSHTITASFVQNSGNIVKATVTEGGNISPAGCTQVADGGSQTYTVTPDADYEIHDILLDGTSVLSGCTISEGVGTYTLSNINASHTIHVNFVLKTGLDITITASGEGTVDPADSFTRVADGGSLTFTFTPSNIYTYKISDVTLDGTSILSDCTMKNGVGTYTLSNITSNHTVAVTFVEKEKLSAVYLNGSSGSDANDGSSAAAAVKTFAGAKSLLVQDGGTIYITGSVSVNDTQTWSLEGYTNARVEGTSSAGSRLILVGGGGTLTLENIRLEGGTTGATVKTVYATSGGTLNINNGTVITGFNYTDKNNGMLSFNIGTLNMNGGEISGNGSSNIVYAKSTPSTGTSSLNFNGGTVDGASAQYAVYADMNNTNVTVNITIGTNATVIGQFYTYNSNDNYSTYRNCPANLTVTGALNSLISVSTYSIAANVTVAIAGDGYTLTDSDLQHIKWVGSSSYYPALTEDGKSIIMVCGTAPASTAENFYVAAGVIGGTLSPSGVQTITSGGSQVFTFTPDDSESMELSTITLDGTTVYTAGTASDSVVVNDSTKVATYTLSNVTSSHIVKATFGKLQRTVTGVVNAPSGISPGTVTSKTVDYGSDASITITPATNYSIKNILLDGNVVYTAGDSELPDGLTISEAGVGTYAFSDLTVNHTVSVLFAYYVSQTAAAPVITTQPKAADYYCTVTKFAPLSVAFGWPADVGDAVKGNVTYQWYINTADSTEGATAISNATTTSFTPTLPTVSAEQKTASNYYFCVVTNVVPSDDDDGADIKNITSNIVAITSSYDQDAVTPVVCTQPVSETYFANQTPTPISVTPKATGGYGRTFSYQWYSNTTNSNENGTAIDGATKISYTPAATPGTVYYYCVVTATWPTTGGTDVVSASAASDPAAITVLTTDARNISLGTSGVSGAGTNYIYFGTYSGSPLLWRILSATGGNGGTYTDGTNTVSAENALFMANEYLLSTTPGSYYSGNELSNLEKSAVLNTYTDDVPMDDYCDAVIRYQEGYTAAPLSGDKLFNLSLSEVVNAAYGFTGKDESIHGPYGPSEARIGRLATDHTAASDYWLRSYNVTPNYLTGNSFSYSFQGCVGQQGSIYNTNGAHGTYGYRSGLNLNSTDVLFTSAAEGGKTGDVGTLTQTTTTLPTSWKLTLLDASREFAVSESSAKATPEGGTVSLTYSGATAGDNEYVSALITDADGNVLYYGKLKAVSAAEDASGSVTVDIPALTAGTYSLKLFSEEANADDVSDYASAFASVTLSVADSYIVSLTPYSPSVMTNGTADLTLNVANSDSTVTTFNQLYVTLTYDSDKFTYTGASSSDCSVDSTTAGTIKISRTGSAVSTGDILTLSFSAIGSDGTSGDFAITGAQVDTKANTLTDAKKAWYSSTAGTVGIAKIIYQLTDYCSGYKILKVTSVLEPGAVFAYNGNAMLTDGNDSYYWVVADSVDLDTVKANVSLISGTAITIAYDGDVNQTAKVDINDAQLISDLYNGTLPDVVVNGLNVSMLLEADVNGSYAVNMSDAAAAINKIK